MKGKAVKLSKELWAMIQRGRCSLRRSRVALAVMIALAGFGMTASPPVTAATATATATATLSSSDTPPTAAVKVQVNDALVRLPDAAPVVGEGEQALLPLQPVLAAMGYTAAETVLVEGELVLSAAGDDGRFVYMRTGEREALVNGMPVLLAAAPELIKGKAYGQLSWFADALGYVVQWDAENGIAIIGQDGRYHAPAWYRAALGERIADTAKGLLGIRYKWGGMSESGFDCSGFVHYVFRQVGIVLPRTSRAMYEEAGAPAAEPRTGDLVFFNTGRSPTHVGIYLGEGKFVSATTSRGTRIDSMDNAYWSAKYIGARRVF